MNGGTLGSQRYGRWSRQDSAEDYPCTERYTEEEGGRQRRLTAFEKLTLDMSHDEKVVKELTLGKRIGFYRVRGEIGSGNFSNVKLGIHSLTKEQTLLSPRPVRRPAPGTGGALPPRHSRVVRRLVARVGAFRLQLTPSPLHLLSGAASVSVDHPPDSLTLWDIKC
ncbi:UNVERIFIED_CONTAM: hypothetical protein FKN15_010054 [Acipenser sinensis]